MDEKTIRELPVLMSAKDLQKLGISRSMSYNLLNRKDMPVVKIGSRKLIIRDDFINWLSNQKMF